MTRARWIAIGVLSLATLCGAARRRAVAPPPRPAIELVDIAGSGIAGTEDGPAAGARFSSPRGIAFDALTRSIVVADTANHTIRRIQNGQVTTIAGPAARLRLPHGVAVDGRGRIWICDTANHVIRRIEPDGTVSTVAGTEGSAGDLDAAPLTSRFRFPEGIAVESETSVIIADTGNHKLRRITPDGVTTIATTTPLRSPSGVAVDGEGHLYVSEREGNAVRRIDTDGIERIVSDGLHAPAGVAVIGGTLYVADGCSHVVRRLPSGETVVEGLRFPHGLAAGDGELLIADTRHHTVRALRGVR